MNSSKIIVFHSQVSGKGGKTSTRCNFPQNKGSYHVTLLFLSLPTSPGLVVSYFPDQELNPCPLHWKHKVLIIR